MTFNKRRTTGAAAAIGLAGVTIFPFCAMAANGDVDVTIKNHVNQEAVNGPNVAVEASFTSLTTRTISRLEFLVDGQVVATHTLDEPTRKGNFIFAWDTTQLPNAVHTISTRAFDDQGSIGSSQLQLFVDNQPIDRALPMIRVTVPDEGAVVSGEFVIEANATPRSRDEKISFLEVKLDDELVGAFNGGDTDARFAFDAHNLSDGPHKLQASVFTNNWTKVVSPPIVIIVNKAWGNTPPFLGSGEPPTDVPGSVGTPRAVNGSPAASALRTVPVAPAAVGPQPAQLSSRGGSPATTGSGLNPSLMQQAYGVGLPYVPAGAGLVSPVSHPSAVVPPTLATQRPGTPANPQAVASRPTSIAPNPTFFQPAPRPIKVTTPARPSSQPIVTALQPAPGHPLVQRFEDGIFWHASPQLSGPQETAPSPEGSPRSSQLSPVGTLTRPSAPAKASAAPTGQIAGVMPIAPGDISPTPVIVVTTASRPRPAATTASMSPLPSPDAVYSPAAPEGRSTYPLTASSTEHGVSARLHPIPGLFPAAGPAPEVTGQPSGALSQAGRTQASPTYVAHAAAPAIMEPTFVNPAGVGSTPASTPLPTVLSLHPAVEGRRGAEVPLFMPIAVIMEPSVSIVSRKAGNSSDSHLRPVREAMLPSMMHSDPTFAANKAHQRNTPQWLRVAYDDHWMNFDVAPVIVKGIPNLPFRAIFEQSGGAVQWDSATRVVTGQRDGRAVRLRIGSRTAMVDNHVVELIMPAFIKKGRTMVPIGFVRQAMNVNVQYNSRTGQILLTSKNARVLAMR